MDKSEIEVIEIKDEVIESVDIPIQNGTSSAIDIKGPSIFFLNNLRHQIYLSDLPILLISRICLHMKLNWLKF